MTEATWLPNLVGGTSIWKLAVDLNEAKFFDGRLLVPETEGSESLPVTVRWDLTGLVPLKEAREKHADDVNAAVRDFQDALQRVAKVFSTPNSGFDKYKDAFTVPSLDADGGASYFYSPSTKKLFVINWGASPRSMGGKAEYVFGYEDWANRWRDERASVAAAAAGVTAAAVVAAASNPLETAKDDGAKKDEKKNSGKTRLWWVWPLFGLVAIALVLLALFLLKACEEPKAIPGADASSDAQAAGDAESTGPEAGADGAVVSTSDGADAAADAAATADGGDAGVDAASADAGSDGGKDGGLASNDDDDDDDFPLGSSGGSSGGTGASGGTGSSGGTVLVKIGPGGGQKTSVHRKHYSDEAQHWRIAAGAHKVSRTEEQGHRFDVWLSPGQTFEGVRVEWQDRNGKWHVH